jgi:hypothetical protein
MLAGGGVLVPLPQPRLASIRISAHALLRFRERWIECASYPSAHVCRELRQQVLEALRCSDYVQTPGGDYYPISFLGKDGFAVLNGNSVKTIMPEEFCPHVVEVRKCTKT